MADFSDFHKSLSELVKSFEEKNISLKIVKDPNSDVIKIFGEKTDSVSIAKNSLEDILELSFTTAEHHPYWNFLYNCSQISKIVLEKWNDEVSKEELDEIEWCIAELKNICTKLKEQSNEK